MDTKKFVKYAYYIVYFLLAVLFSLIAFAVAVLEYNKNPSAEFRQQAVARFYGVKEPTNPNFPDPWPPVMNKSFPEISLVDSNGQSFKLSDFSGKVIIVEYVDMNSPLSHSYSGAKTKGTYGGTRHTFDESTQSLEDMVVKENAGQLALPHPDIIVLKVVIYNEAGQQAKPEDAQAWAQHFGLTRENNYIVAVPEKDIRGYDTNQLIPGFQLIDKDFLLRVDSSGANPKHSLQFRLVTLIPTLLQ